MMATRRVWLCRHAERMDQHDPQWLSHAARPYDPPLSPHGLVQARETAERLAGQGIAHVVASPYLRTVQMAHIIAQHLGLTVKLEPGVGEILREGTAGGREPELTPARELAAAYPTLDLTYESDLYAQYPEDEQGIAARVSKAARQVLHRLEGDLLVIGHGASVSHFARALLGENQSVPTPMAGVSRLDRNGEGGWIRTLAGDVSHLSQRALGEQELADKELR